GAAEVFFDIRIETTGQADLTKFCIREGADPSFKTTFGVSAGLVTVGATGFYATIDDALDAIAGSGQIVMVDDEYGPEQRITPSKVAGHVHIIGQKGSTKAPPVIRMAEKVTGITK